MEEVIRLMSQMKPLQLFFTLQIITEMTTLKPNLLFCMSCLRSPTIHGTFVQELHN